MDLRIDRLQRRGAADDDVICLGGGLPADELLPRAALTRAFLRAVEQPRSRALQYGWPEGEEELRAWVAGRLVERGARVVKEDVIITNGAQQAIDLAVELTTTTGDAVACGEETYSAALDLLRARERRPIVHLDGARAAYVMPGLSNPRGRTMTDGERARLLAEARSHDVAILEDDAYADLCFDGRVTRPLLADDRERVLSIGTVSKTLSPGLRVGWLVTPASMRDRALSLKHDADLQAGSLSQAVVAEYLAHEDFARHVRKARRFYARRARSLTSAIRRTFPGFRFDEPEGGFAVWVETDRRGDDTRLLEIALRHGVSFDPGRSFRTAPDGRVTMRLSFASESEARIEEGVRRLLAAWRELGEPSMAIAG